MTVANTAKTPTHHGGHLGLAGLLCMLAVTSCAALVQNNGSGTMGWLPGWGQVQQRQKATLPAQVVTVNSPAATFIVRFKNEPEVDEICKMFRRDGDGARAKFSTWRAGYPQLAGLTLASASYSGEMILALPSNDPARRSPVEVLAKIKTMNNLAYAELDEIAHPSAKEN